MEQAKIQDSGLERERKNRRRKIFYGWWIVLGAFLGIQLGFTAVFYTFGVFLKPIAETFLWSRGEVAFAISLGSLGSIVGSAVVGRLMDRYGVRPVILVSSLFYGAGLALFRFLPSKIWFLYLLFFLLGVLACGTTLLPYITLVSRWFEKRRGIALGLAASGGGAGGFLLPPLFQFFIERLGWIDAYAVLGILSLLVVLPVTLFLLKEHPAVLGLLPDGEVATVSGAATGQRTAEGLTWPDARKTVTFWLLACGFFFMSAGMTGSVIHLVPFLTDRGMTPPRAALYVSLLAGASLLGRLTSGYMADRWIAKFVAMIFFSGAAAGIFVLWLQPEDGLLVVAVFAVGLAFGAEVDLSAYLIGKSFGLASFGQIYSYIYGIFVLGAVVGPAFAGILFDHTGSYQNVLLTFFVAVSMSAVFMGPTRSFAEITSGKSRGVPPN